MLFTWIISSLAVVSTTMHSSCLAAPLSNTPDLVHSTEPQKRHPEFGGMLESCTVTYKGILQTIYMDFNNTSDSLTGITAQQGADQVLYWLRWFFGAVTGWTVKDDGHGGLQAWANIPLQANDNLLQTALDHAGVSEADHDCTGIPWADLP